MVVLGCVGRREFDVEDAWEALELHLRREEVDEDVQRCAGHDVDEKSEIASQA